MSEFDGQLTVGERLLHEVGKISGKLDGVAVALAEIKAENIRCDADRENLARKIGDLKSKQSWIIGLGTGAAAFLTTISALLHYR